MMPNVEDLERWVNAALDEVRFDLPHVSEAMHQLWMDISRFGPRELPSVSIPIPGLGSFEIPPRPANPPPLHVLNDSWTEHALNWTREHPYTALAGGIAVLGTGIGAGYGFVCLRRAAMKVAVRDESLHRREVVVVLGADVNSLADQLVLGLERAGYVVLAIVATTGASESLHAKSREGFIRAVVFDPAQSMGTEGFCRSIQTALSLKYPTTAAGDPYVSTSSHLNVHAVISLLSLLNDETPTLAPLERISIPHSYLPYLTRTHISPLALVQSLIPLLRTGHTQSSILFCVPATDARVGLAFTSPRAVSAVATVRAAEVLRRELRAADASSDTGSKRQPNIRVVDVGFFDTLESTPITAEETMARDRWSAQERSVYGNAFTTATSSPVTPAAQKLNRRDARRRPSHASHFVNKVVLAISNGTRSTTSFGFPASNPSFLNSLSIMTRLGLGAMRNWLMGDRFSVGAGAGSYGLASYILPRWLLDGLLQLPHLLSMTPPFQPMTSPGLRPNPSTVTPSNALTLSTHKSRPAKSSTSSHSSLSSSSIPPPSTSEAQSGAPSTRSHSESEAEHEVESEETAEVSSAGVGESWVALSDHQLGGSTTN